MEKAKCLMCFTMWSKLLLCKEDFEWCLERKHCQNTQIIIYINCLRRVGRELQETTSAWRSGRSSYSSIHSHPKQITPMCFLVTGLSTLNSAHSSAETFNIWIVQVPLLQHVTEWGEEIHYMLSLAIKPLFICQGMLTDIIW